MVACTACSANFEIVWRYLFVLCDDAIKCFSPMDRLVGSLEHRWRRVIFSVVFRRGVVVPEQAFDIGRKLGEFTATKSTAVCSALFHSEQSHCTPVVT